MKHIRLEPTDSDLAEGVPAQAACGAELVEVKVLTSKGFDMKHERELLVDEAWKSDCEACRAPVLKHMRVEIQHPQKKGKKITSACGKTNKQPLVRVARESDCNNCRSALLIAPVQEKNMGLHKPEWEPQPRADADELCASARKNREGA